VGFRSRSLIPEDTRLSLDATGIKRGQGKLNCDKGARNAEDAAGAKKRAYVKQADGEVLIYDLERNKAHCLNNTAARVWQYCDGERR